MFEVLEDCLIEETGDVIPKGFECNLVSSPRFLWWLIPPHGAGAKAAIAHDYYYMTKTDKDRAYVDRVFLIHLLQSNMKFWQAFLMYAYVRAFGWYNWRKYRKSF